MRISRDGRSVDRHWVCATWIPRNGPPVVVNADRLLMHGHVSHAQQSIAAHEPNGTENNGGMEVGAEVDAMVGCSILGV